MEREQIRNAREIANRENEETNHNKTNYHLHARIANPCLLVLVVVVVKGGVGSKEHAFRVSNNATIMESGSYKWSREESKTSARIAQLVRASC